MACSILELFCTICLCLFVLNMSDALDNGLVSTPPMGWLSWERFRCNTNCEDDPDNCIGERLYVAMSDLLVEDGYASAGYQYVIMDDCWMERRRLHGQLVADIKRFPHGLKWLSDYVHSRGLRFGIYHDVGNLTCAGYPGLAGHMREDADMFARWEVDYVKVDGCHAEPGSMDYSYPMFGRLLNRTGRPMVYSCSWPSYQTDAGMQPDYTLIGTHCNLWRNHRDIQDSWDSVEEIIDYYGNNQDYLAPNVGPGRWNDPDMLIVGNFGLSYEQCRTQMALWAILAAPLLMSVDLRNIRPEFKEILLNRKIIAIDQDYLGIQGRRIYKNDLLEIWTRAVSPMHMFYFSYAVVFLNRRVDGAPSYMSVRLKNLGLYAPGGYVVEDLYENNNLGVLTPRNSLEVKINPTGVVMLKAVVQSGRKPLRRRKPFNRAKRLV